MNLSSDGMDDAQSVISSDSEHFSSMLPNIIWRPTNLTALASANLTTDSIKQTSFIGTLVAVAVTTYLVGSGLLLGNVGTIWTYIGYFAAALFLINIPTFKKMSAVAEQLAKCEAAFKFVHSRIRMHAETIALYGAEDLEKAEVARSFDAVMKESNKLIIWQSLFQSLQVLFQYVPFLISGHIYMWVHTCIICPIHVFPQASRQLRTSVTRRCPSPTASFTLWLRQPSGGYVARVFTGQSVRATISPIFRHF